MTCSSAKPKKGSKSVPAGVRTYNLGMLVSDFDYDLPSERIAQKPLEDRAASRLLHLDRRTQASRDRIFRELPDILRTDDLLVLNNTRVFAARLYGQRSGHRAQTPSSRNRASRNFLHG